MNIGNILYDQSIIQLLYNIIHWLLGVNLIIFAYFEFRRTRRKTGHGRHDLLGPSVFAFNGLFFVAFVLLGHLIYIRYMGMEWRFDHEHVIHLIIGLVLAIGGTLELTYRTKRLRHKAWHSALPLSLVISGSLFLHPQHGLGSVLEYMTLYHRLLAAALILSGLSLGIAWYLSKSKLILNASLCLTAVAGLVFITYRHQYNTQALCVSKVSITHDIKLDQGRAEPDNLHVSLCDKIRFVAADDEPHYMAFGGHSHHASYPAYGSRLIKSDESQTFTVSLGGTFSFHDHLDHELQGLIIIERPQDLSAWSVRKY